jgi:CRP-like cAMP-binding protein
MSQHPFQSFMVRYRAGERVFAEGDPGSTMFVVHSGRVALHRTVSGQRQSLGLLEKGDFFGEMSILEGLPRTSSAEALDDAELIEINSMIFDKMIRGNIEIAVRMLRKLSLRLREAETRLAGQPTSGSRSAAVKAAPSMPRPAGAAERRGARLEAREHDRCYPLAEGETLIGRYDPATELKPHVDLTELDLRRSVSRRHARILRSKDGFFIVEEVGALQGTQINGSPLDPGVPHPIADGDQLSLGNVAMVFRTSS